MMMEYEKKIEKDKDLKRR